jgi:two-component system, NarL family, sensor histidine kinase LiaS
VKRIFDFFRTLRGKLILTYTLVTVLALLAVEALILTVVVGITGLFGSQKVDYLQDVIYVMYPQARTYLQPGGVDIPGLQRWLEGVYDSGYASQDPTGWGDSPKAAIVRGDPMYVLSLDGTVLAQAPLDDNNLIGRKYTPPNDVPSSQEILDHAYNKSLDPLQLSTTTSDGSILMAVPILREGRDTPVVGVLVLTVKAPPPQIATLWPLMLGTIVGAIVVTGALLTIGVAPFGALFGFIMSRGLTRRLRTLTQAVDAWSEGDFSVRPQDRSQDEIGTLGLRMRHMAERTQALLQTQHELVLLEERNRLARELHDTIKQQTFATQMQVRAAKNLLEKDPSAAREHLDEAEGLIKTSQQELGRLILELRPAALEDQGLAKALADYVEGWSQHTRIPVTIQVSNERRLSLAVDQALYRVAQEALANIARHSHASQVALRLDYTPEQVCLYVSDNGAGFDAQSTENGGFGLHSMRERAESLGGLMLVQSDKGQGTKITVQMPVEVDRSDPGLSNPAGGGKA